MCVRLIPDIDYGDGTIEKQRLDIYQPPHQAEGPLPVVIHFHGGGWARGGREIEFFGAPSMAAGYAAHGLLCVAPSYRLGECPAHMIDCALAVAWAFKHIAEYGET